MSTTLFLTARKQKNKNCHEAVFVGKEHQIFPVLSRFEREKRSVFAVWNIRSGADPVLRRKAFTGIRKVVCCGIKRLNRCLDGGCAKIT